MTQQRSSVLCLLEEGLPPKAYSKIQQAYNQNKNLAFVRSNFLARPLPGYYIEDKNHCKEAKCENLWSEHWVLEAARFEVVVINTGMYVPTLVPIV
jgi:hypothetical protein